MTSRQVFPAAAKSRNHWGQLYGSAATLAIAEHVSRADSLTLVVATSMAEAYRLEDGLQFFLPDSTPILSFPDWETLPYDLFSPHQEIISQRLKTLYQLPSLHSGVLVLPVSNLMQPSIPRIKSPAAITASRR